MARKVGQKVLISDLSHYRGRTGTILWRHRRFPLMPFATQYIVRLDPRYPGDPDVGDVTVDFPVKLPRNHPAGLSQ